MSSSQKRHFVPDLSHLHDALFETEDKDEETLIFALIEQFQSHDSWPIEFYKKGFAAHHLKPFALEALGKVVQHYEDEMESRKLQAEYERRYPVPTDTPPKAVLKRKPNALFQEAVDLEIEEVKVEPQEIPMVDLVSESVSAGVAADIKAEEEIQQQVRLKRKGLSGKKAFGSKRKGKTTWVPSVIVCGLEAPDDVPVKSRKGKEKVIECSGIKKKERRNNNVDRLNLGGSGRRISGGKPKYLEEIELGHDFEGFKLYDIFIEDDDEVWKKFKVVEEYDSGLDDDGPDIPMSPPLSEELNPNDHIFLLLKKGPSS